MYPALGARTFAQLSLLCFIGQPCGQNVDMLTHCISADMHEMNMHARGKMVVVVKIDFSGQIRRAKPIPTGWRITRSHKAPIGD